MQGGLRLNFPEHPKLLWPGLCPSCSCGNDGANNSVSTGKSPRPFLEREVLGIAPQGHLSWILSLSLIIFWKSPFFSTDYMSTNLLPIMLSPLNTTPLFTHHLSMVFQAQDRPCMVCSQGTWLPELPEEVEVHFNVSQTKFTSAIKGYHWQVSGIFYTSCHKPKQF